MQIRPRFLFALVAGATFGLSYAQTVELTPLQQAIGLGDIGSVDALLSTGADLNDPGKIGVPPLLFSIYRGRLHVVQHLLEKGPDLKAIDWRGNSLIHYLAGYDAVMKSDVELIFRSRNFSSLGAEQRFELLVAIGSKLDVDKLNGEHVSALHLASVNAEREMVGALLMLGANPNVIDKSGATPLHYVVRSNTGPGPSASSFQRQTSTADPRYSIARMLLRGGSSPSAKDKNGRSPLDDAESRKDKLMIAVLRNWTTTQ